MERLFSVAALYCFKKSMGLDAVRRGPATGARAWRARGQLDLDDARIFFLGPWGVSLVVDGCGRSLELRDLAELELRPGSPGRRC